MTFAVSTIIDTGRALMAALQPLTGNRAIGQMRLRTKPGVVMELPRNTYWIPVIDGARHPSWMFKVGDGPNENNSWTINDSGNTLVDMMSNLGGIRHNIKAGTVFVTDIDVADLVTLGADAPHAELDFQGARDPEQFGLQDMALYETFDGPGLSVDLRRSPLRKFPGALLAFQDMTPADGVTIAQNNQGAVNAGDGKKLFKISYSISVVVSKTDGDHSRRFEGLVIADTIAALLNDRHAGDGDEPLSNPAGVQVRQLLREDGPQDVYKKFYIYTLLVSCMRAITRIDFRVYYPWLRTSMNIDKPQLPRLVNQGPYRLVDNMKIDMTPMQLDFLIDGTFARASIGYLWDGEALTSAGVDERRTGNPNLGTYLESAVTNAIGAAAEDFTLWTAIAGALVTAATEIDPLGGDAQVVSFDAQVNSGFESPTTYPAAVGEPTVFQVFARANGVTRTTVRLVIDDGITTFVSDDFVVGPTWDLLRFTATPSAPVKLRVINASDGLARNVALWGAMFSNTSRWGAMYPGVGAKAKDTLVFGAIPTSGPVSEQLDTPAMVLGGQWHFRWRSPDLIPPDEIGTGLATVPTLVSVGNGYTELVTLKLVGTPSTGGANLTLTTRQGGVVINLTGVEWNPGAEMEFLFDVPAGVMIIAGTNTHDGEYTFPRYDQSVDIVRDHLVIGDTSAGTSAPVPGFYILVGSFTTEVSDLSTDLPFGCVVVNGVPVTYNGAYVISIRR